MARKKDTPNKGRAETCKQIRREKGKRKWWQTFKLRAQIVFAVLVLAYGTIGGWWSAGTSYVATQVQAVQDGAWQLTADAGFALQSLRLEGRKDTPRAAIEEAIALEKGTPLLAVSVDELKQRLSAIPEVADVQVERRLPDGLVVRLQERQPRVIWQHQGKKQLVDASGVVLKHLDRDDYTGRLPVVTGEDAADNMTELLEILDATPQMQPEVVAAQRIGGRRWNVRLDNGLTIMLPESEPLKAWRKLAELQASEYLFTRQVEAVDFRLSNRIFLTMSNSARTLLYEGPGQET